MTDRAIAWLKKAQKTGGSISAWIDLSTFGDSYPEVSGYVIPTLLAYGEAYMAHACAEYLMAIQRRDGAFPGLDGLPRTFDTGACYEGLMAASRHFKDARYNGAATKAKGWLRTMARPDGALRICPSIEDTNVYTCRVDGLLRREAGLRYWTPEGEWHDAWGWRQRVHYIAYGLEGLWRAGLREPVIRVLMASRKALRPDGLMPFYVEESWVKGEASCLTGTAQMAMLYRWAGMDATALLAGLEKARHPSGGFIVGKVDGTCVSWAAKFYLDAVRAEAQ